MKIALVVHDLRDQGGHSLYTKILANELSVAHEVGVFANTFEDSTNRLWQAYHVPAFRASALTCVQTFPFGMILRKGSLAEYQIVHTQGYCGGKPNVITAHICVAAYRASLRDVSFRHDLSLRLMAAAESRLYRDFRGRVIAVSQKVANELREFYDWRGSIDVIPHGVDFERFNPEQRELLREAARNELGVEEGKVIALYVGDLTKAHSYLKELSAISPTVHFLIVTSSSSYHWSQANVTILPGTAEIERYYAAADAFVFPTTYDAFGIVILEAMASGLPVFISDRAGAADLIESDATGFIFPLGQWVEACASRLLDPALLSRIGTAAAKAATHHGWSDVVKSVEQVYREVA